MVTFDQPSVDVTTVVYVVKRTVCRRSAMMWWDFHSIANNTKTEEIAFDNSVASRSYCCVRVLWVALHPSAEDIGHDNGDTGYGVNTRKSTGMSTFSGHPLDDGDSRASRARSPKRSTALTVWRVPFRYGRVERWPASVGTDSASTVSTCTTICSITPTAAAVET